MEVKRPRNEIAERKSWVETKNIAEEEYGGEETKGEEER